MGQLSEGVVGFEPPSNAQVGWMPFKVRDTNLALPSAYGPVRAHGPRRDYVLARLGRQNAITASGLRSSAPPRVSRS